MFRMILKFESITQNVSTYKTVLFDSANHRPTIRVTSKRVDLAGDDTSVRTDGATGDDRAAVASRMLRRKSNFSSSSLRSIRPVRFIYNNTRINAIRSSRFGLRSLRKKIKKTSNRACDTQAHHDDF